MNKIRLGKIVYTNVWPIYHGFPPKELEGHVELVTKIPASLNADLANGLIDAAAISSFAYGEHADKLLLLPNLSVSAKDAVGSIFLLSKEPLSVRLPKRVALSTASATSIHLLKIIFAKKFEHNPEYVKMAPDLTTMMESCDAALLIGDDAIRASWREANRYEITDVATLWSDWTGLGMTFAVWAIREEWAIARPTEAKLLHNGLLTSKENGVLMPDSLLDEAVQTIGGTKAYWHSYFSQLNYDFGEEQQRGLELYFRYAHELGFIRRFPSLRLWRNPM